MSQGALVSVLIPSYNHASYLRERIESIYSQSYPNIELIVIDDFSTDESNLILINLQAKYGFTYMRNPINTGTPFSAWEIIGKIAKGEYVWICESDDFAEPLFLEVAVKSLEKHKDSIFFYSNSFIVGETSEVIGDTLSEYFHPIWESNRWDADMSVRGLEELINYQLRGQIVPNMSACLIRTSAFRLSYEPFLKKLKLTGDWLFIGNLLTHGGAIFSSLRLSNFRRHEQTARVRVRSAGSQAEFIITKFRLFKKSKQPLEKLAPLLGRDVIRFLYEGDSLFEVLKNLFKISPANTIALFFLLPISLLSNRELISKFFERYSHAKQHNADKELK